jgi:Flp pilus assembly protein TadG
MTRCTRCSDERGSSVLEMAIVFPIVFLVLLGSLSAFWMLSARSTLSGAARDGARFASIRPGPLTDYPSEAEVEAYVRGLVGDLGVDEVIVVRPTQPNAPLSVTVRRSLPILVDAIAGIFGDDELVFESEIKVRGE